MMRRVESYRRRRSRYVLLIVVPIAIYVSCIGVVVATNVSRKGWDDTLIPIAWIVGLLLALWAYAPSARKHRLHEEPEHTDPPSIREWIKHLLGR